MMNRNTIHIFKSYMQLFEKMNIINYVISFIGVVRATMEIFSSDARWIVERGGNSTEKTDATHSTGSGRSCFTIIITRVVSELARSIRNRPYSI